jgi:hypothetical protein
MTWKNSSWARLFQLEVDKTQLSKLLLELDLDKKPLALLLIRSALQE